MFGVGVGFPIAWLCQTWLPACAANTRIQNLGFRGFDSSISLIARGGIPSSTGSFLETSPQRSLACGFLVCGLAVRRTNFIRGSPKTILRPPPPSTAAISANSPDIYTQIILVVNVNFQILRGGNNFPEIQAQRFLVCGFLVWELTVHRHTRTAAAGTVLPREFARSTPKQTKRSRITIPIAVTSTTTMTTITITIMTLTIATTRLTVTCVWCYHHQDRCNCYYYVAATLPYGDCSC